MTKKASVYGILFLLMCSFQGVQADKDLVLIPGERFIGNDRDVEEMSFIEDALRVKDAQNILADKTGQAGRVFHRKNNGTVLAEFEVLPELPPEVRFGIFENPSKWLTLVRLSGGVGVEQSDLIPDVMGFAMKLLKFDPSQPLDGQTIETMDWLMTNSTTGFGNDQREFVEFMEANLSKGIVGQRLGLYFAKHPKVLLRVLQSSLGPHAGSLFSTYGSGHPYLLNSDTAMKFSVELDYGGILEDTSVSGESGKIVDALKLRDEYGVGWSPLDYLQRVAKAIKNPHYLRDDFYSTVRYGAVDFVFSVEIQDKVYPENTPIEEGLKVWKAEKIPVARLTVLQQEPDALLVDIAEGLGYTPGAYLFGHRPAGRTGRGRLFTYQRSQEGRKVDPARTQKDLKTVIEKATELKKSLCRMRLL